VENTAEVYYCLNGRGYILMERRDGAAAGQDIERGQAVYIPPRWAHRSVNVGDEEFVFFYAYPGGAGHDYEAFDSLGFRNLVVERDGAPVVVPNPRFG
jgi:glucose-6-phosphate isomerase